MNLVYFLGRFHVLALHLPLGILSLAVVLELLVRHPRGRSLERLLPAVWIAGALSALLTVMLGIMHATEGGFQDSPAVEAHRWAGMLLALAAVAAALWRWAPNDLAARSYRRFGWLAAIVATSALMVVTGHLGGNLTHGETYLVQYAPKPVRRLAGLSAETDPRDPPKDLASADIYLDIVAPALHARCDACHNEGKRSGGFSLADHAALMKGGKAGAVVLPGAPDRSDLLRRISLSPSDKDYMPKDGKTPLTPEQTAAIKVWIAAGAPKAGPVGSLKLTGAQKATLRKALPGTDGGDEEVGLPIVGRTEALPEVPPPDAAAVVALTQAGFVVRPLARSSRLVSVDYTARRPITARDLATLARIAPQIRMLNLRAAGLDDAELKRLGGFPNLVALRLEGNAVTDAGMPALLPIKTLRSLNLVNTRVGDAGLARLAALPAVERVFVWGSLVSPTGVDAFNGRRKGVVDAGLKPSDVSTDEPVVPPVN